MGPDLQPSPWADVVFTPGDSEPEDPDVVFVGGVVRGPVRTAFREAYDAALATSAEGALPDADGTLTIIGVNELGNSELLVFWRAPFRRKAGPKLRLVFSRD